MKFSKSSQLFLSPGFSLIALVGLFFGHRLDFARSPPSTISSWPALRRGNQPRRADSNYDVTHNPARCARGSRPFSAGNQSRFHGRHARYPNLYVANQGSSTVVHSDLSACISPRRTRYAQRPPVFLTDISPILISMSSPEPVLPRCQPIRFRRASSAPGCRINLQPPRQALR